MKYPNEKLQPSIEPLEISKSQLFSQEWPINMKGSERESLFQKKLFYTRGRRWIRSIPFVPAADTKEI